MPFGTLDRRAPSFLRQGPSALSQVILYSALALFLMVADARWRITNPLRQAVSGLIYPMQWLTLRPVDLANQGSHYFKALQNAQKETDVARKNLAILSLRANQSEDLRQENNRLRQLLELRPHLNTPARAAQILYDTSDPYTRRVVVDLGQAHGIELGSPALDDAGVLGQVTRVYPFLSEVTLLVDREQAIPVLNSRTNARGVAYGDPIASHGGGLELRFVSANADVQEDDLLTTSGMDGVYPPGLPVARVIRVERRADSAFARIYCAPTARIEGARHVLLVAPMAGQLPERPEPAPVVVPHKKGKRK